MGMIISLIMLGIIFSLWFIAGKYEWQIPVFLAQHIQVPSLGREENCEAEAVMLNIEAREFIHEDIEKEIYIIKKSKKNQNLEIVMNINFKTEENKRIEQEKAKSKHILEKRFPGLTVKYSEEEQVGNNAFLYPD